MDHCIWFISIAVKSQPMQLSYPIPRTLSQKHLTLPRPSSNLTMFQTPILQTQVIGFQLQTNSPSFQPLNNLSTSKPWLPSIPNFSSTKNISISWNNTLRSYLGKMAAGFSMVQWSQRGLTKLSVLLGKSIWLSSVTRLCFRLLRNIAWLQINQSNFCLKS